MKNNLNLKFSEKKIVKFKKTPQFWTFVDFRFFKNLKRENPAFVSSVLYAADYSGT